jgi:lactoylglutathione lyase
MNHAALPMDDWAERKPSVVFACEDIQRQYEAMLERGVTFQQPPRDMPWGRFAIFLDTEGNWFGLREGTAGARESIKARGQV